MALPLSLGCLARGRVVWASRGRKLTEVYQTVHLKEFTDFPKKDEKDPTEVFTDIHFEKKSVAHEAYHLSHGFYH